ncbi:MAG TPA: carboxypeptidase regulatory-like domain-containing protein [Gemmatimonadaceae bacterium]|nr:carboxypeptidase regulatory-like domain-containing protein [Gemmatimonadaceae bacterium]
MRALKAGPSAARWVVALWCISALVTPIAVSSQSNATPARTDSGAVLRGRVVRQSDAAPIVGADVWVASVDRHATTDSSGGYRIPGLRPGAALIQVRHVGFDVERDTVNLSIEHENVRTYALAPQSTTLDTVRTIAGKQQYLSPQLRGFEERRLSGQGGHFVSDSVLRRNEAMTLASLITSYVPGVTALAGKTLVSSRKACMGLVFMHNKACSAGSPDCYVTIYLDGALYYTPPPADAVDATHSGTIGVAPPDLTREILVSNLAGAEYYADGTIAPGNMHSNDQGCGTLWLWTRER